MMDSPLYQTITITGIEEEVKGFKLFYFEGADARAIAYKPGQYLTFVRHENDIEVRRSYSITATPLLNEPLSIGVKRIENGLFSRNLIDHAKEGDQLLTTGAGGFFTLPDQTGDYEHIFFLAAGSGITPVFSLLKTVLYGHRHLKVTLIYSNHAPGTTVFYHALKKLQEDFAGRLHIEFLFSNSPDLYRARLHPDLLIAFYRKHAVAGKTLFYVCGPANYMRMCVYTLQSAHVPPQDIRKEDFVIVKPLIKTEPPDKEKHRVNIRFMEKEYVLGVQYPDSILVAAKKQGVSLPYSCEAGRCGNCVARCEQGTVWMSNNEVLTDKDLAKGLVLTCVGYPVGGDVYLQIQ